MDTLDYLASYPTYDVYRPSNQPNTVVVKLKGYDLAVHNAQKYKLDLLAVCCYQGVERVVLDLGELHHIDSTGARVLTDFNRALLTKGVKFIPCGINGLGYHFKLFGPEPFSRNNLTLEDALKNLLM